MIERTLILIKPDGVERGLIGKIISRFEDPGFKIIAMKMVLVDKEFAKKDYTADLAQRRGENVRKIMVDFITQSPVVALVLEGINTIENIRKIVGPTEPKSAQPGTIRGDFSHISYSYADNKKIAVKNIIHASSSKEDAEREIKLWFKKDEIYNYSSVHEKHLR